ncbi:MAG: PQQ-binding-like beta-propeller repeat protein, partial [Pirellulaceae bacterium]|nr:PQQ-binding-like beta-propeller repeat protein [Pirellulaceae bacterium]
MSDSIKTFTPHLSTASRALVFLACCCLIVSAANAQQPWGSWAFEKPLRDGRQLKPQSGNLSGTIVGAPEFDESLPAVWFKGTGDRVVLGKDVSQAKLPVKQISVETWVRVDHGGAWCGFVSAIQDNGTFERGWMLGYQNSRFCFGLTAAKSKRIHYLSGPEPIPFGFWIHVVGTYNGRHLRLYENGRLIAETNQQQGDIAYAPKGVVALGAYVDDNEVYPLSGALSRVAIYDEALTGDQVKSRFEASRGEFEKAQPKPEKIVGWPTYMRDYERSGRAAKELSPPLKLAWTHRTRHPPSPAWPAPAKQDFWHRKHNLRPRVTYDRAYHVVSDGASVFFGSSTNDEVAALDLSNGRKRWSFFAGGPVRLAPSIHDGAVYFGSDDGRLYALDAQTGEQLWRRSLAPTPRVLPGNGRLISAWPVRTGVLIADDKLRCGAGLFPQQGVFQFAVDRRGKVLAKGDVAFSAQGYLQRRGGSLMAAQGRAPNAMLDRLKRIGVAPPAETLKAPARFPFAWIGAGDIRFGGGASEVAAFDSTNGEQLWSADVDGDAYSLAVVGDRLLVSTDRGVVHCFQSAAAAPAKPNEFKASTDGDWLTRRVDRRGSDCVTAITRLSGNDQGYALVLGGDAGLIAALASQTRYRIACLEADATRVQRLRRELDSAGLYGTRVSLRESSGDVLPFASHLFNAIVGDSEASGLATAAEIDRVLHPLRGVALLQTDSAESVTKLTAWSRRTKEIAAEWSAVRDTKVLLVRGRPIPGAGRWTHMYGNAANTACSDDERVAGPLDLQWFGRPGPRKMVDRHHRTTPPIVEEGRMFVPADERVIAVDTYNGAILWETEMAGFRRVGAMRDAGNLAADRQRVYAITGDQCYALDAGSGAEVIKFTTPGDSERDWGYLAALPRRVIGSATQPGASRGAHERQQIAGTYYDFLPVVVSAELFSVDPESGKQQWRFQPRGAILNPTITIGENRVYFVESGDPRTLAEKTGRVKLSQMFAAGGYLTAVDTRTGELVWRREVDFKAIQHHLYLAYADGMLLAVGTRNEAKGGGATVRYDLWGFRAKTGEQVWRATQDQGQA